MSFNFVCCFILNLCDIHFSENPSIRTDLIHFLQMFQAQLTGAFYVIGNLDVPLNIEAFRAAAHTSELNLACRVRLESPAGLFAEGVELEEEGEEETAE